MTQNQQPSSRSSFLRLALALAWLWTVGPARVQADGVVTSCDQESLEAAIANGGTVLFDCDGAILLTNTIAIADADVTLDATGHTVTIASPGGTNGVRLFSIGEASSLALINLKLVDGVSTNGAAVFVSADAILSATTCVFSNNMARGVDGLAGISASTNSTRQNGDDGRGGKAGGAAAGGAIYNLGFTSLDECTFLTNSVVGGFGGDGGHGGSGSFTGGDGGDGGRGASGFGGAVYNGGELSITACTFNDNQALGGFGGVGGANGDAPFPGFNGRGGLGGSAAGAAVFNHKVGILDIVGSTFALNGTSSGDSADAESGNGTGKRGPAGAESSGGALANYGTNTMVNCTFFANAALGGNAGRGGSTAFQGGKGGQGGSAWGGNVFNGGKTAQTYATNCTFSDGGAIGGTNGLGGDASFPGKVGRHGFSRGANIANSNGLFVIKNCIVAYPNPGTNAYGKFRDDGFNLSSDRSIKFAHNSGSKTNDPLLDVLHKNGGLVETLELLTGSPAIDAADTNFCLGTDARGVARPSGARCDIGAYEAGQRLVAPVITVNPVDQSVQEHGLVTFRVTATGDPPLRYQWRKDDTELDGSTNATHTVTDAAASDKGSYDVVVSNNSGSTTSEAATLTVLVPPSILQDPEDTSVFVGESFTLTVTASGDSPLRYRWLTNGVPIPGAVLDQYTVVDAQTNDAGEYQVEVCNDVACVLSEIAQVDVIVMAPSIITQPVDQIVAAGRPASFTVQASGTLPLTYLWRKDSVQVFTETLTNTSSTLSIPNAQPFTNGPYDVIISNPSGSVTSAVAVLTAQTTGPAIVSQPVGATVVECDAFALTVGATGSAPLRYQWYLNNRPLAGATSPALSFSNVLGSNAGSYYVVITNAVSALTSSVAVVNVQLVPPIILQQPADITGYTGDPVAFRPAVCGSLLSYQWFFNATNAISGATNASLVLSNAGVVNNGTYHFVVTNLLGATTSAVVSLNLTSSPPIITEHPAVLSSDSGPNFQVTFRFGAVGSKPLQFQWFFNDVALFGPVNTTFSLTNPASGSLLWVTNGPAGSTLTVTGIKPADEGSYLAVATNSLGVAFSNDGSLDVRGSGSGN